MQNSHYERIGGEKMLRKLVNRFYELMDQLPETVTIRQLHAPDLDEAEDKLFMFLSGWLGGPALYIEKYGHPRLRQRHIHFAIGEAERDQWMLCMTRALDELEIDYALKMNLLDTFYKTADFMRNR
ncbi:MAG: group II truncated hemoglobin [Gammaproteobacteria bacterium]|nr:group II truncated hemoglobin [Gammaproteobacteria bacterium]